MSQKLFIFAILILFLSNNTFAYKEIEEIATKAGGYNIPIKICITENASGKLPVMFFVHGGGWNGGDDKTVPPASVPADCAFLCDELGIIYVGLAYRCKGNKATFHDAIEDLEASVKWFEKRADNFNADMSRIGFSGGSAGTTLSAVLANRHKNCKVYVGREGMYNVLDIDSTLSNFPNAESRADFGLVSKEQKLEASPFYQVRKNPPTTLLLHGKDDWLCHYSQSIKYSEQIKKAGGNCKVVLYDGINHTCLNINYPEVFKNSLMEIAHFYAKGYKIKNVDFDAIQTNVDNRTKRLYPYQNIPDNKLAGSWKSRQYGTFIFEGNGEGVFANSKGKQNKRITYRNNGSWFSVRVEGEEIERTFYLRRNDQTIYELITENNRWKSRRNDYRKL